MNYPTKWAYEAACKALWYHRDRSVKLEKIEDYVERLATDRNFKPLCIVEDLQLILDGHPPDTPMPETAAQKANRKAVRDTRTLREVAEKRFAKNQTGGMVEPPHDVLQDALRRSAKKVHPPEKTSLPEEVRSFPEHMRKVVRERHLSISNETRNYVDAFASQLEEILETVNES